MYSIMALKPLCIIIMLSFHLNHCHGVRYITYHILNKQNSWEIQGLHNSYISFNSVIQLYFTSRWHKAQMYNTLHLSPWEKCGVCYASPVKSRFCKSRLEFYCAKLTVLGLQLKVHDSTTRTWAERDSRFVGSGCGTWACQGNTDILDTV